MINQGLELKLAQKLSPLQIQTIKLIELPIQDLEQRIRAEIEENPVLDDSALSKEDENKDISIDELQEDDYIPSYRTRVRNWGPDARPEYNTFSVKETFSEGLEEQLSCRDLTPREKEIGQFIIGSLDTDGYLRRDIESLVDDMAFRAGLETDSDEVLSVLRKVQELDPAGVGARTLPECLLLQLARCRRSEAVEDAERIISTQFQEFSNKHFRKIMSRLDISEDRLKAAMARIVKLNPSPGGQAEDPYAEGMAQVVPDFVLEDNGGELSFSMPRFNIPEVRVSPKYAELLQESKSRSDRAQKDAAVFVKQKVDSAKWFVEALKQRQNTLNKTMQAILDYQHKFFLDGDESSLRPMVLKDIAEVTGFDISTVSRVVNSKYIQTDFGIFPLKYFFSEGMENTDGDEVSTRELKKALKECVDAEDKNRPLTDEQLAAEMLRRGYKVARRTIAKYRDQLGIPLARWRKEI